MKTRNRLCLSLITVLGICCLLSVVWEFDLKLTREAHAQIVSNGNSQCLGNQCQWFSVSPCTPASSTDSQCTGTITLPVAYADANYIPQMLVNNNVTTQNAQLLVTVNGPLTSTTIPYALTCTFFCTPVNAPTIYVFTRHN